jgi:hypothetical protein
MASTVRAASAALSQAWVVEVQLQRNDAGPAARSALLSVVSGLDSSGNPPDSHRFDRYNIVSDDDLKGGDAAHVALREVAAGDSGGIVIDHDSRMIPGSAY